MKSYIPILLVAALGFSACSGKAKRGTDLGTEVIRASDANAQREFDEGVRALEESRWADAVERFRTVQAQYPGDPIAVVAELYAARAGLAELNVLSGPGGSLPTQTLAALAQLAESREDNRVKWAAAAYYAAGLAAAGQPVDALEALQRYPSPQLSPVVLARDRPSLQVLVAEALLAAGRFSEALAAYGGVWRLSEQAEIRRFAKARGFEAAARVEEAELVDWTGSRDDFERAVAGATLLERRAERAADDEREALQELMRRVAPDLATIDEATRLEGISATLAARAPAQRLAIGLVLPLSGGAAQAGRAALDGALVAVDAYGGTAASTTVVLVDSASADPAAAVARLRVAGVAAIVGPLDNKRAPAWATAANDAEIPLFALTTEPLGAAAGDWAFRWFIDAESEARGVARVAVKDQGDVRIAVLHPNIAYGRKSAAWFTETATAQGATVVLTEEYDRSATDYSRLAARVAKAQPDAIFIPDAAVKVAEVSAFLAQANVWGIDGQHRADPRSRRVQVHYLGTSLWNDPTLLRDARSYVAGALVPAWSSPAFADAATQSFVSAYQAAAGGPPSDVAAFAADAIRFVQSGFDSGVTDPLSVRERARGKSLYRGITGPARFGAQGEPIRVLRFVTVTDAGFAASPRTVNVGVDDPS